MLMTTGQRPAIRTLWGWAIGVLREAGYPLCSSAPARPVS